MIIKVKVKPNSKAEIIEKISDTDYVISLREKAKDGKANIRLVNLLAKEFGVNYRSINIKNPKSREKIIEIKG